MIKQLEDFNKCVAIGGFRDVKIEDVNDFINAFRDRKLDVDVQYFDAKVVAGWEHLYFAALNALNTFKNKVNVSRNLAVEALLFASSQRQILKAVELMGIKPGCSQIAVLVIAETKKKAEAAIRLLSESISGERDDRVLEVNEEKTGYLRELFDISDIEIGASTSLVNLIIEHMAISVTRR